MCEPGTLGVCVFERSGFEGPVLELHGLEKHTHGMYELAVLGVHGSEVFGLGVRVPERRGFEVLGFELCGLEMHKLGVHGLPGPCKCGQGLRD